MHNLTKTYLLLALLPFASANIVTQISDGQIQEPAEAPSAYVAPKIATAPPTIAPAPAPAAPPPRILPGISTFTTTSTTTPAPSSPPPPPPPPAIKEAGAISAPLPIVNTSISSAPAPANVQEAATTAPILIAPGPAPAPASNVTVLPHPAVYEVPLPSASVGKVLPVENGTAFAVPAQPTVGGAAATSAGGSPREAGTMRAVSKGGVGRVGVSGWVGVFGVVGLVVVLG